MHQLTNNETRSIVKRLSFFILIFLVSTIAPSITVSAAPTAGCQERLSQILESALSVNITPDVNVESNIDSDDFVSTHYVSIQDENAGLYPIDKHSDIAQGILEKLEGFEIYEDMDMSKELGLTANEIYFIMQYSLRFNGTDMETMITDLSYNKIVSEAIASSDESVNELFIISVIYWETARFTSNLLKNNNNFGGCLSYSNNWMSFESGEEGVNYEIEVIHNNMSNGADIFSVNSTYCPDDFSWGTNVLRIMKQFKQASIDAAHITLE